MLLTTDAVGGIWRYSVELAHGLSTHSYRITLATVGPRPSMTQTAELPSNVTLFPTDLPLDWLATEASDLDRASQILAALEADIALLHAPAYLRHRWPFPVVVMAHSCLATWFEAVRHTPVPADYAWRAQAAADGLARADAVAAPTAAFAAAIERLHGLHGITVIHNGRDPLPPARRERTRAILTAGRLWDDGKDAALLDRIAPRLAAPTRAAGPTAAPHVRAHLPNLTLLGTLDEPAMAAAYAGATVFASPALYEPFGLAVLEAAQAGMTLVLADIPTFRELWDGAATFVAPRDDDAWIAALATALDHPAPATAHAAHYTRTAMADGTAALLRRMAA